MIWIIGGTTETREIVRRIKGKAQYIVTTATYSGKEVLNDENTLISRMNTNEMIYFIKERNIELVVDMTHPYALEVTKNAKEACVNTNIKYIRFVREKSVVNDAIYMNSLEHCIDFVKQLNGCVFFTTGIKNIRHFEKVRRNNRFVYRVLPSLFSLEECVKNNVQMRDIVAILGPISKELNKSMFLEYKAKYVVMKDSGKEGGIYEKVEACKEIGVIPIIIGREGEQGVVCMDTLERMILLKVNNLN